MSHASGAKLAKKTQNVESLTCPASFSAPLRHWRELNRHPLKLNRRALLSRLAFARGGLQDGDLGLHEEAEVIAPARL